MASCEAWGVMLPQPIKQEDLITAGRKGQLIDINEAAEFGARHMLGA